MTAGKEHVRAWVDAKGISVASQDEADACAIAWAGRKMVQAASWNVAA
jgi:hypothetical protein